MFSPLSTSYLSCGGYDRSLLLLTTVVALLQPLLPAASIQ